ncbi:DinB family protein [Streptomyces sp. NPDC059166]|uniref:DinB family protein n=1 Tax=Streptomyces sp. NPDC059166 TaxID=3346752 RepID=UPI0036AC9DEB
MGDREVTGSAHPETAALLGVLRSQRAHVLGALDGLDEDALHRPVLPSGWSCLGLVRHLALDVERFWFRAVVSGDPDVIAALEGAEDAWAVRPGTPSREVLARYRAEASRADGVIEGSAPDAALAWWPPSSHGQQHLHTLRDVMLHVITETACHAGHIDAVRELLDGRRWLVMPS